MKINNTTYTLRINNGVSHTIDSVCDNHELDEVEFQSITNNTGSSEYEVLTKFSNKRL